MSDYEQLVKALRNCYEDDDACATCQRWLAHDEWGIKCKGRLISDAAAAIEALLKENKELIEDRPEMVEADGHWEWRKPNGEVLMPKRGKWIVDGMYTYNLRELNGKAYEPVYRCSCCNRQMESYLRLDEPKMPEDADFPEYCPHCGAKMEVQE